ncbi:MAG: hypothetical protein SO444_02390 [Candidatus Onthomorpha sp.]|nr:hypothetical protein [Candidatus Onthomorpha sp.]
MIFKLFTLFGIERRFVNVKTPIYFRKTAFRPNKAAFYFSKAARRLSNTKTLSSCKGKSECQKW